MSQNQNKHNSKFFIVGSIGWGLLGGALGLALMALLLAYLPKPLKLQNNSYWTGLLNNLSSAFAASAILTLTLELANNYQRNKDLNDAIQEIQNATTDGILKELIGDEAILGEVKTHVLKQNFIRKNFKIAITLNWDTSPFKFLLRSLASNYSIHNLTSQPINYPFRVIETKENEFARPNSTQIIDAEYDVKDSRGATIKSEKCTAQLIGALAENSDDSIKLEIPVEIPPDCRAEFKFSSQSLLRPDSIDPIVSLNSTTDMEIDLVFPYEISAEVFGIHPDPDKFELQINQRTRKRWRAVGLLPGQGILLSLKSLPGQEIHPQLPPELEATVSSMLDQSEAQVAEESD